MARERTPFGICTQWKERPGVTVSKWKIQIFQQFKSCQRDRARVRLLLTAAPLWLSVMYFLMLVALLPPRTPSALMASTTLPAESGWKRGSESRPTSAMRLHQCATKPAGAGRSMSSEVTG